MGGVTHADASLLFAGGPPLKLQRWLRIGRPGHDGVVRRACLTALVGWLPLFVIAALQPHFVPVAGLSSFVTDLAVVARSLLAAPLFILAEASCVPRLAKMAQHFLRSGLVAERDHARYEAALSATRRLLHAPLVELAVVALSYALVALILLLNPAQVPAWQLHAQSPLAPLSPAGWWHALVSLPLLLSLLLGWLWRLVVWVRFLWSMSRLELRLIAAHPDLAAGLGFLGYSVRAFAPVGFALGVVVAGTVANGLVHQGLPPQRYLMTLLALAGTTLVVFAAPLVVFGSTLARTWHQGVFDYGAAADHIGRQFERRWFSDQPIDASALTAPDFSAMVDLYQTVSNVYGMKVVPLDVRSMLVLGGATLLPFAPLALLSLPLDVILSTSIDLLF